MSFSNVIFRTNPTSKYDSGDHMHIFNRRLILCKHAEHLCFSRAGNRKFQEMTADGLLDASGLGQGMMEKTRQYRYDRVSKNEFTVTRLSDNTTSAVLPGDGTVYQNPFTSRDEVMNLELFLNRRLKVLREDSASGLPIFGLPGSEFWYGGKTDTSDTAVSNVWDEIEVRSANVRTDTAFRQMPGINNLDLANNCVIELPDVPDHILVKIEEHLYDPATVGPDNETIVDGNGDPIEPIVIRPRRHRLLWEDMLGINATDIARMKDKGDYFDYRSVKSFNLVEIRDAIRRKRYQDTEITVSADFFV
jgi:hypothetical protein